MPRTEAKTRKDLIDPALAQAGWDVHNPDQVGAEHLFQTLLHRAFRGEL
jgi:predicted type IV restriction endonuclease